MISSSALLAVRAAKIDDHLLAIGWYTYEAIIAGSDNDFSTDTQLIYGHGVPGMLFHKGNAGFYEMEMLLKTLQKQLGSNIVLQIKGGVLQQHLSSNTPQIQP